MPERGSAGQAMGARLLVVDDNKVNRMLLARSLELEGHRVSTAQDGREALELVQREPFDLVLLDMEMPEVDGFTVLETLQADAELREVPVIVTSSLEGVEHVARCIELGADDFLQKPVHPVLLKARVGSSLAKKRQRDLRREELQRELAHQVAERSRALGDAFARATPAPASLAPRTRFGARYEVVRSLGEGGMGAVFEVERATDGARLALKVMTGQVSRVAAARFAREAEIGARLRDPHLVSIVDVGVTDTGTPFLVMELVTGGSLEGRRASFGDVAFAVPVLRQVARGLSALHSAGVVHRDLKPSNVLLDARGAAKVSDFGLARFADHLLPTAPTAEGAAVTRPGAWLGTPLYMAPEAVVSAGEVTPAADVFALGILAYELLSGASPFATPPVLLASAGQPLPVPLPLAQPPGEARAVLRACLSEEAARRPLIAEVLAALG